MFAEELGGNASKRRQEEARARRRQLKEREEQKKKLEERARVQQTTAAERAVVSGGSVPIATSSAPVVAVAPVLEIPVATDDSQNVAVKNALQLRQQRQAVQRQNKAALSIQSFFRMHRSNMILLHHHAKLLGQRLQDLNTLTNLLKQQLQNQSYVPPPATSTALVSQVLFVTRSLPYFGRKKLVKLRQNASMLQQLIELAILPGIFSKDENVNPFLVWMQSKAGQQRIEDLIRLTWVTLTVPSMASSTTTTTSSGLDFLRAMMGIAVNDRTPPAVVVAFGKKCLWSSVPLEALSPAAKHSTDNPAIYLKSSLDMISLLRFHLLYNTGGPDPIPKTADRIRELCIPASAKSQADQLFRMVLQGVDREKASQVRFVSEILTVPLLSWKTLDALMLLSQPLVGSSSKPRLISFLESFILCYSEHLNAGEIGRILCNDISLTACPATPTQILLANLVHIGRLSPALSGTQPSKIDFEAASTFYQFIVTLVDAVPLATFSSRESVVEWISDGKGHHSPVVLSSVVMEQCKSLLVDSYVRKLLDCAIDNDALKTEAILQQKNEKDIKQQNALRDAGGNAASLAAQEAKIDRTKSFFQAAGWAKRIKGGMSKLMSKDDFGSKKADSKLINTSSVSRKLANGKALAPPTSPEMTVRNNYSTALLKTLCRLYGVILARWGGDGGRDCVSNGAPLVRKDADGGKQEIASTSADQCTQSLLNNFVFSTDIIQACWGLIQSDSAVVADVYAIIDPHKGEAPVRSLSILPQYSSSIRDTMYSTNHDGSAMLFVFVSALSRILIVTDDSEIHDMEKPLPLHQLRRCIQTLKQLLYRACCLDNTFSVPENGEGAFITKYLSNYFGLALITASARTMRDLYDRSSRRPLSVPKLWLIEDLMEKEIRRCKTKDDYVRLLTTPVLRVCPFLVSFKRRLTLFERIVTSDRVSIQGENSQNPFHTNPLKPGIPIRITRGRILEDGLATMNHLGRNMRQRLAVQYYNEAGARESGVDVGGLFKEFWTDLCAIAFDPNYALFRVTGENCMYPNPSSNAAHGSDHITLFEFLGRILGKALYEGITVGPQFAHFFLSHLRGDYKYLNMLSDLSTMDPQLYTNIMFLKTYDGDAEDLCLTFTVAVDDFGGNQEIPLMPNGANVEVTDGNKQRYIQLVAKHYVVDRIKEQAEAFTRGLREVIDRNWLEIFNEPELQVLISGASDGKLDVEDMRSNCRYVGGFTGIDRTVNRFWSVVASMDSKQQADLLRFVTSCERPPPLGFASLNPPLTIQRVGIMRDGDRLPTSATCFNVLKLPTYSSEKVMKERLLYAIQSGAGFELT